jgi:ribosomal protein S25
MTEITQQSLTTAEPANAREVHKAITSTQRVFDAVRDLREVDQIATRETVAELTGLKMSVVDDRLRALVDDGKLKRLLRGIYELVEAFPEPRELSCTTLSNGWVKLELGDELLRLTPTEARRAARALGGFAEDARVIESTRSHLFLATELAAKVESQGRELKTMRAMLRDKLDARQRDLLGFTGPEDAEFRDGSNA